MSTAAAPTPPSADHNATWGNDTTVGGGYHNYASDDYATIGGGYFNTASAISATVSGGVSNTASGNAATIGGGEDNTVTSTHGTIGGGLNNTVTSDYGTVPGGQDNKAGGQWSFAAGYKAEANHQGTFVWADSQGSAFASTANNQFLIRAAGGVGIGTATPDRRLDILDASNPQLRLTRTDGTVYADFQVDSNGDLVMNVDGQSNQLVLDDSGSVGIGTSQPGPTATLDVSGTVRCNVLHIDGGADLAEPFEIVGAENVKPGMVVAIDPQHPGQLRIADTAYDRMVAGCVSGAGGLNPGLTMEHEGTAARGSFPVALSGRVYCWGDASYGPIQPGDLLTTSDTPGHVMKVADYERAHGAIIGKAMSSLDEGRGLILILVTLQ